MSEETTSATNFGEEATITRKQKARGKVTIIRERCKGCVYCVAFCPQGYLEMSSQFNDKGYHFPVVKSGRDCSGCDLCGMYCPDFAISGTRTTTESESTEP